MFIVADEPTVFATLDTIAIMWMFLKILVNQWIDAPTSPKKIRPVKKAA